jgi:RND family efflux transporter MFP subunit
MYHTNHSAGPARSSLAQRAVVLLAAASAPFISSCSASRAEPPALAHAPIVQTVVVGEAVGGPVRYTGNVRARIESDLGFRVSGKITERLVDPGQRVHEGQALMRLDPADLALNAAAAAQRLRAAEAQAERAVSDELRQRGLISQGAISQTVYDAALAAARATAADVDAARAASHEAQLQEGYATLYADADGVVLDVVAQPGQVVPAGMPVVKLGRSGSREALVDVPETAIALLPHDAVAVVFGSTTRVRAHLREVSGAADPLTRTFAARYTLDTSEGEAPLGATVTIEFAPRSDGGLLVPLSALYDPGTGSGVWVVASNNQVSFRLVTVQQLGDESASVTSDSLRQGDTVVSLGAQMLRQGEIVQINSRNPS